MANLSISRHATIFIAISTPHGIFVPTANPCGQRFGWLLITETTVYNAITIFMPLFEYIALDAKGSESLGVVEATNQNDVVSQLRSSGYFPTSVVLEGQGPKPVKGSKTKVAKGIVPASQKKKGITLFQRKTVKS